MKTAEEQFESLGKRLGIQFKEEYRAFNVANIQAIQLDAQPSDEVIDAIVLELFPTIDSPATAQMVIDVRDHAKQILLKHLRP